MDDLRTNSNMLRHPVLSILATLFIFFIGFQLVGTAIGGVIAMPFYPGSETEYWEALKNPMRHPELKVSFLIIQGTGALVGMIIIPWFFLKKQNRLLTDFFTTPPVTPSLIVPILVIVFMGVNAFFISWNQDLELPFGLDEYARPLEKKLAEATVYMTQYDSLQQIIVAFIVIAIIPAVGEEVIFRGMIQNDFMRATRNPHVSIWAAAILFSAIHFQFYGFVPRMLLGALFGYLYYWSGNLWMPVIAHFVNNGFTLAGLLLFQRGAIPVDIEKAEPTLSQVMFSALFSGFLLYAYKNFYNKHPKADIPD
jgi:uncharacterized protein